LSASRDRSAQIRMTETIAVLFIFFVLVLFGIIFYYKYQQVSLVEKQEELLGARAIETTLKTLFLPELICSRGEAETEDNCFDMLKLRSINETFKRYLENYYFDIFSYSRIYVQEIYPGDSTYLLYDKVKPDAVREEPTFFVVTLRDEIAGKGGELHKFGYVAVVVYS